MITQSEFLEIIEKHLKVRNDGSVYLDNRDLADKFITYLKRFAIEGEDANNRLVINIVGCPTSA